jgi:hypothetical protein
MLPHRPPRNARRSSLRIEQLEDRDLLAVQLFGPPAPPIRPVFEPAQTATFAESFPGQDRAPATSVKTAAPDRDVLPDGFRQRFVFMATSEVHSDRKEMVSASDPAGLAPTLPLRPTLRESAKLEAPPAGSVPARPAAPVVDRINGDDPAHAAVPEHLRADHEVGSAPLNSGNPSHAAAPVTPAGNQTQRLLPVSVAVNAAEAEIPPAELRRAVAQQPAVLAPPSLTGGETLRGIASMLVISGAGYAEEVHGPHAVAESLLRGVTVGADSGTVAASAQVIAAGVGPDLQVPVKTPDATLVPVGGPASQVAGTMAPWLADILVPPAAWDSSRPLLDIQQLLPAEGEHTLGSVLTRLLHTPALSAAVAALAALELVRRRLRCGAWRPPAVELPEINGPRGL